MSRSNWAGPAAAPPTVSSINSRLEWDPSIERFRHRQSREVAGFKAKGGRVRVSIGGLVYQQDVLLDVLGIAHEVYVRPKPGAKNGVRQKRNRGLAIIATPAVNSIFNVGAMT